MNTLKMTSTDLRLLNREAVFSFLYAQKKTTKQELALSLRLSMPTIHQNLQELESLGLLMEAGLAESTGGRKARLLQFNGRARAALGLEILKDQVRLLAVDLYGNLLQEQVYQEPFVPNASYLNKLSAFTVHGVDALSMPPENLLGINIAVQALTAPDGSRVTYSKIYDFSQLTADFLQPYLPLPCRLIHDTAAAAFAELWFHKNLQNAVVLMLNRNLGGALILNGQVFQGVSLTSDALEHLCLEPWGETCYCGQKGCMETLCSAEALQKLAGEPLDSFFTKLRQGSAAQKAIWEQYLQKLALGIHNIRSLFDVDFIIGGFLLPYITEEDFLNLKEKVQARCPLPAQCVSLHRGRCGPQAAATGAALLLVEKFLQSTGFRL